ncbi:DnaJ-like subfamily B member 12 [Vitis vinifera]|uniref:DnaJ-like subfamily B member 12 n=1 Tax=Vitis vinifera TaxID=29760 RepID=A0A438GJ89_VITVI|nr:DnaJ-like subfamily B member 12 [Vitis vinifera]
MECNKDEASRAKDIAVRKFREKDFLGAKKFVLKAQNLYPGLEGLSQMLTILDVYISAEKKVSGEVDWYGILGVSPLADEETVKKQYRKLALILHPDKNKSIGADGAFKLVSEAWSLLSDKGKRLSYNQKRDVKGSQQKVPSQNGVPSAPASANGVHNFTSGVASNARTHSNANRPSPTSVPSPSHRRTDTFWTVCNRCKTQYEYLRIYLNHTLLCPNCHEAFLALGEGSTFKYFQWDTHSRTAGVGGVVGSASSAAQAASEKRREVVRKYKLLDGRGRRIDDDGTNGYGGNIVNQTATGNGGTGAMGTAGLRKGSFETERVYGVPGTNNKPNSYKEMSLFEIRNMLMEKARKEIRNKLSEWSSTAAAKAGNKEKEKVKLKEKQKGAVNGDGPDPNKNSKKRDQAKKFSPGTSAADTDSEAPAPMAINVPDSDFHDFDLDRTESSFGDNQVWSAYDDDDGMPRFYALIHKVISLKPFKMKISWLNSKSNSEFGSVDWIGSGFTKTCGDFRIGRHEIYDSLNSFSHRLVEWTKGTRGAIRILPKKGDVWALYRNWSPDWNENTPDEVIHKYDMVEVLDDYNEDYGVSVTPLIKVAGFRTIFHRHEDPKEVRTVLREEMFCFSHQVPNRLLTGQEAQNAPKGCRELDPAATPLELLQIITEATEAPVVNVGKDEEGRLQSAQQIKLDKMVDYAAKSNDGEIVENSEQIKSEEIMGHAKVAREAGGG